jgi:hypothetical protein
VGGFVQVGGEGVGGGGGVVWRVDLLGSRGILFEERGNLGADFVEELGEDRLFGDWFGINRFCEQELGLRSSFISKRSFM